MNLLAVKTKKWQIMVEGYQIADLKCIEKSGLEDAPAAQGCTRQATALAGSNKLLRPPLPYLALPRLIVPLIVVTFCLLPHV